MIVSEPITVRRHDLVWIDVDHLSRQTLGTDPAIPGAVEAWFRYGRPAVVCRQHQAAPDRVCLGVPLPPREGGARVALLTARAAMRTVQAPPALTQVIPSAPVHWREPLQRLALAADALGISLSVYGSLLWQHLTGESYVTSRSDIDLLLRVSGSAQLLRAFQLLRDWEHESGLRADGEVQLADGAGVAWRELASAPARVLVKSLHDVQLRPGREVLRRIATAPT
jgi:phosphoribosyl-dephospho-CoA transferase